MAKITSGPVPSPRGGKIRGVFYPFAASQADAYEQQDVAQHDGRIHPHAHSSRPFILCRNRVGYVLGPAEKRDVSFFAVIVLWPIWPAERRTAIPFNGRKRRKNPLAPLTNRVRWRRISVRDPHVLAETIL